MSAIAVSPGAPRTGWRQLLGFNMLTGIIFGIVGWFIGYSAIGIHIHGAGVAYYSTEAGQNDIAIMLGYLFGVIGFLVGLGFGNYPFQRMLGAAPSLAEKEAEEHGLMRYFSLSTDHKVVAKQYMIGIGFFFVVGGLNAMLIRTELLQPNVHVFGANQYLTLVGMHGSMMMGIMTSGILGPFANWLVPLMIGTRRMAFPRIESFTFWLLMAGSVILVTTIFFGGFQTGWTGYQPLGDQGTAGYDAYIGFFALRRAVDDAVRLQPHSDDHHDAGSRDDVVAATDLRVGNAFHRGPDDAGRADADRRPADGGDGPDHPDRVLRRR